MRDLWDPAAAGHAVGVDGRSGVQGAWPVAAIRAAERALLAAAPEGSLMARAARAVAVRASALLGGCHGARVRLLVGAGDNGGDALYAGAELARRGAQVEALLVLPERAHPGGLAAFRRSGGRLADASRYAGDPADSDGAPVDLVVDGLLGIGAHGAAREPMASVIAASAALTAPVLAVDLPSGLDPDTGVVDGPAVRADVTLCMGALKPGLLVGDGPLHAGRVTVVDIGLGDRLPAPELIRLTDAAVGSLLPRPGPADDKYTRGVVGVAAGSQTYPGAALLAVGSARLGGVGAVRYAGHAAAEVVRRYPEVLVTDEVAEAGRVQAWAVGPGLGDGPAAVAALQGVLAADAPVVVDADGLTLLAHRRGLLSDRTGRGGRTVLTPHDREFERLFGPVGPDRLAAARRAAADTGATVLLKGFATVVADPDGRCLVNPTGTPALATAGSGDVLSGLLGSLLAAGLPPAAAAGCAAYLHGCAGSRAAAGGPVVAGDLVAALRAVMADLAR